MHDHHQEPRGARRSAQRAGPSDLMLGSQRLWVHVCGQMDGSRVNEKSPSGMTYLEWSWWKACWWVLIERCCGYGKQVLLK
jgi:hypothetical protein